MLQQVEYIFWLGGLLAGGPATAAQKGGQRWGVKCDECEKRVPCKNCAKAGRGVLRAVGRGAGAVAAVVAVAVATGNGNSDLGIFGRALVRSAMDGVRECVTCVRSLMYSIRTRARCLRSGERSEKWEGGGTRH